MAGARHQFANANDSQSLWNYTLSPGWNDNEARALRLAIMRYGCGNWAKIQQHFPDKTNGQLNLQTQRLFGQQSLSEWNRSHVDPLAVKQMNDDKKGVVLRKNSCIVNTGDNLTVKQRAILRKENIEKFGIAKEDYKKIKVPVIFDKIILVTFEDKLRRLSHLYRCYFQIEKRLKESELSYVKLGEREIIKKRRQSKGLTYNNEIDNLDEINQNNNENNKLTNIKIDCKTEENENNTDSDLKENEKFESKIKDNNRKRKNRDYENDNDNDDNELNNNQDDDQDVYLPPASKRQRFNNTKTNSSTK